MQFLDFAIVEFGLLVIATIFFELELENRENLVAFNIPNSFRAFS